MREFRAPSRGPGGPVRPASAGPPGGQIAPGVVFTVAAVALALQVSCASAGSAKERLPPPSLLGPVSRAQIEAAEPAWSDLAFAAPVSPAAALALAEVPAGADVEVYFGTWCSDSRRELPRLWKALDTSGPVPFEVRYLAVDHYDKRPPELERDLGLRYVPTIIVRRDSREVGRVVETSPHSIEKDLLALLTGEVTGWVSAREDRAVKPQRTKP